MKKLESISWMVLVVSISITALIWSGYFYSLGESQHQSFSTDAYFLTDSIRDELDQYEQILVGAKGLFAASDIVDLDEWHAFVEIHDLKTRYPGLQGVGYAEHVLHEDREKIISMMRNYGVNDFQIKPSGDRDEYYPILFLEPSDVRNQNAIGYDVFYEQTRQNAVDMVKATGETTITGKIILVQEIDEHVQNGFLMMAPIHSNSDSDNLQGIVYTVFRIDDFVSGTVDARLFDYVELKIYDDFVSDENLFFNSESIDDPDSHFADFSTTISISIDNRNWIFVYDGVERPFDQIQILMLLIIPVIGLSMSFLLFYVFRVIAKNLKLTQDAIKTEKISAMGTMASRLSHDLRNPLTVIKSTLQLMTMNFGSDVDEKTEKFSKRINDAVDSMSDIIEDVLRFSKTYELKKETISLNQTLQTVLSGIDVPGRIKISLPKDDHAIHCDESKMASVFSNLITNSIQAIDGNGTISIRANYNANHMNLSFEDSGPGIPEDKLDQIFEPLFTTKSSGTGLGLGICKNIVEQHGGTITVKNNPTTFNITMPKN